MEKDYTVTIYRKDDKFLVIKTDADWRENCAIAEALGWFFVNTVDCAKYLQNSLNRAWDSGFILTSTAAEYEKR